MLKLFIFTTYTLTVSHALYPGKLFREEWGNQLMANNLVNLTQTIVKDALYKLRMADRIQEQYKYTLAYELGLLTSSITDYFKHMTRIYRFYSNHYDFKTNKHNISTMLNAYHIMQGEYNLIRAEKDLYYDAIDRFQKKKDLDEKRLHRHAGKHKGLDPDAVKQGHDKGISLGRLRRRSMNPNNNTVVKLNPNFDSKTKYNTVWNNHANDTEEAAYKKKLRYKKWAEKWRGFNPEIEGVNIPDKVAAVGLANASNFLVKELKGVI